MKACLQASATVCSPVDDAGVGDICDQTEMPWRGLVGHACSMGEILGKKISLAKGPQQRLSSPPPGVQHASCVTFCIPLLHAHPTLDGRENRINRLFLLGLLLFCRYNSRLLFCRYNSRILFCGYNGRLLFCRFNSRRQHVKMWIVRMSHSRISGSNFWSLDKR